MSAYVISEVEFIDIVAFDSYRTLAAASIAEYGGKYLVRGAVPVVAEGDRNNRTIVVVEFDSMERIQEWYHSKAYAAALIYREKALRRRLLFVDGLIALLGKYNTIFGQD